DHHDHADHHEHDHGHDHDHKSSHHDQDSGHLDLHATYTFQCKNPKDLKWFGTLLFEQFEHSETLKLQGLTDQGQRSAVMTRKASEVQL
ncbi:MAG: ZrgA family zinc uptake protein, partial [Endozoicomonas sp.]